MAASNYSDRVFINCPFDDQYRQLFRACTFTVLDAGFVPRCSREVDDASTSRLDVIVDIIDECQYGIHDLSRVQLDQSSHLPRFNMPFELGLFHSAKHFGPKRQKGKQCIVLEKNKYRYQKFISDIAGMNVTPHSNSQKRAIHAVRNWLVTASRRTTIPAAETIHKRFKAFQADFRKVCKKYGRDYDSMPFIEMVHNMNDWLQRNQIVKTPLFGP